MGDALSAAKSARKEEGGPAIEAFDSLRARYPVNRDPCGILPQIRCFALDLDGTVYLEERWIPGAREFLARLAETGRRYCFMTNNSSKSAAAYLEKLDRMGLRIDPARQLVTSGQATAAWLREHFPGRRVWLFGNPVLLQEFEELGVRLEEESPDLVVTAFDTGFDYPKLCRLCGLVRQGLPWIATHPDYNCPTPTGVVPDIGALHAYVQASTGRMPDEIIGKPNRPIVGHTLRLLNGRPQETAVVGDRLYTDIRAGAANGLRSIFVLSGEASLADLPGSPARPDLIFDSVREIIPLL